MIEVTVVSVPRMEGRYWGGGGILFEDVSLVEFLSFVFSRIPGKSYHRQLRFLLL